MKRTFMVIGLLVLICVLAVILYVYYVIIPIKVSYVKSIEISTDNYGEYWIIINNKTQIKSSDIDTSDLSFDGSSYIFTFGRELKELKCKRLSHFPFTSTKLGIAYLGKTYHFKKMFI